MNKTRTLLENFRELFLVYYALKYNILQSIEKNINTIESLSTETGIIKVRLIRLLRGLCWKNILASKDGQIFTLTEIGADYLANQDILLFQGICYLKSWPHMDTFFEKGENPYVQGYHENIFSYITQCTEYTHLFATRMQMHSQAEAQEIRQHSLWNTINSVVDIGGGNGHFLLEICQQFQHLQGTVFDLPLSESAFNELISHQPIKNITFQPGNFFADEIPKGYDLYILKWILHDWDDTSAVQIISNCHRAMKETAHLWIIDKVMPEDFTVSYEFARADLNMLALNKGQERSQEAFQSLLDEAGFALQNISSLPGDNHLFIIDCVRI